MLTAEMVAYLVKLALLNAVKRVSLSPPPPPPAVPVGARDAQISGKVGDLEMLSTLQGE